MRRLLMWRGGNASPENNASFCELSRWEVMGEKVVSIAVGRGDRGKRRVVNGKG